MRRKSKANRAQSGYDKIGPMRITRFCLYLLLLSASTSLIADIYVYRHKDGSVLITEYPQTANQNYTLIEVKRTTSETDSVPKINVHTTNSSAVKLRPSQKITSSPYDSTIKAIAAQYGVDDKLIKAIIRVESAFKKGAVSPKGAQGLMQLMPGTAARYGVRNSFDPVQNLLGGVRYFKDLLNLFNNNLRLALAAYNAGENAVQKYNGIPPYKETRQYVQKVIHYHRLYTLANT